MTRYARHAALMATAFLVLPAAPAVADGPVIERASYVERFEDDYILDLCGIETWTTVTERWSSKKFPDGSEIFHVVRPFVPDDPLLPRRGEPPPASSRPMAPGRRWGSRSSCSIPTAAARY